MTTGKASSRGEPESASTARSPRPVHVGKHGPFSLGKRGFQISDRKVWVTPDTTLSTDVNASFVHRWGRNEWLAVSQTQVLSNMIDPLFSSFYVTFHRLFIAYPYFPSLQSTIGKSLSWSPYTKKRKLLREAALTGELYQTYVVRSTRMLSAFRVIISQITIRYFTCENMGNGGYDIHLATRSASPRPGTGLDSLIELS